MNDAGDVAGDYGFRAITVRGRDAAVHFPQGRDWRLKLVGGRWLVAAFPILPDVVRTSGLPADLT
jgi:hypothetical protein